VLLVGASAPASGTALSLHVFVHTKLRLGDVVWTGSNFLYVEETTGKIQASAPDGSRLKPFAKMPRTVEEFRCRVAPDGHGFHAGDLFCHAPDNVIYRITPSGSVTAFATLPETDRSDGAFAFDTSGQFGYAMLAATGASGDGPGGTLYAVYPDATVSQVGSYPGPGGAENLAIAPAGFGPVAGQVLLTIDHIGVDGTLLAMDAKGKVTVVARVTGDGINSLALVTTEDGGAAKPGLYISDTKTRSVWFAPAGKLRRFAGDMIVAAEQRGWIFVVSPSAQGYKVVRLRTNLTAKSYNFEGATYVG
jgi:hypothetical protein